MTFAETSLSLFISDAVFFLLSIPSELGSTGSWYTAVKVKQEACEGVPAFKGR